mmetsp:Transcript_118537/g.236084  ORF Transcript_118537/g.236084 Transcript_118537/m.236084 type:complete len:178 (+) Transcript_118537:139-672(+)
MLHDPRSTAPGYKNFLAQVHCLCSLNRPKHRVVVSLHCSPFDPLRNSVHPLVARKSPGATTSKVCTPCHSPGTQLSGGVRQAATPRPRVWSADPFPPVGYEAVAIIHSKVPKRKLSAPPAVVTLLRNFQLPRSVTAASEHRSNCMYGLFQNQSGTSLIQAPAMSLCTKLLLYTSPIP